MNIALLLFSAMCFLLSYEFSKDGKNKHSWLFIIAGFVTLSMVISNIFIL